MDLLPIVLGIIGGGGLGGVIVQAVTGAGLAPTANRIVRVCRTDLDKLVRLARGAGTITTLTEEEMALGKIVRVAGNGTRCYLLHGGGILDCATDAQLAVAFTVTGQDRGDIPTISLEQFNAWGNHVQWGTPAGVFKVLDRHEDTLKAIAKKLGA